MMSNHNGTKLETKDRSLEKWKQQQQQKQKQQKKQTTNLCLTRKQIFKSNIALVPVIGFGSFPLAPSSLPSIPTRTRPHTFLSPLPLPLSLT